MMNRTLCLIAATLIVTTGCATVGNEYETEHPAPVKTKEGEFVMLRYRFVFDYQPPGVVADSEWSRQIVEAMVENMGVVLNAQIGILLVRFGGDHTHDQLVQFSNGRRTPDALAERVKEVIHSDTDFEGVHIYRLDYDVEVI